MDERVLWVGRTLRQWLPVAVEDVVRAAASRRIVLFGSVARGGEGPDSDLDLLVVFDRIDPADRTRLISSIRRAISARAPIDVIVTDLTEYERRKDVIGSMAYWPAREGEVVYERSPVTSSPARRSASDRAWESHTSRSSSRNARRITSLVRSSGRIAALMIRSSSSVGRKPIVVAMAQEYHRCLTDVTQL